MEVEGTATGEGVAESRDIVSGADGDRFEVTVTGAVSRDEERAEKSWEAVDEALRESARVLDGELGDGASVDVDCGCSGHEERGSAGICECSVRTSGTQRTEEKQVGVPGSTTRRKSISIPTLWSCADTAMPSFAPPVALMTHSRDRVGAVSVVCNNVCAGSWPCSTMAMAAGPSPCH